MQRFLLFAGNHYYPGGGWDDYRCGYDELAQAYAAADKNFSDETMWFQVVDTAVMKEVSRDGTPT
jgi:hypothetical protein